MGVPWGSYEPSYEPTAARGDNGRHCRQSSASEDCQSLARTRPSAVLMLEAGVVASPISVGSGNQHCRIKVACAGQVDRSSHLLSPNSNFFWQTCSIDWCKTRKCDCSAVNVKVFVPFLFQITLVHNAANHPSINHWQITPWVCLKITRPKKTCLYCFKIAIWWSSNWFPGFYPWFMDETGCWWSNLVFFPMVKARYFPHGEHPPS